MKKSLTAPLKWRKPRKIFVNPMSDLFHERVPFDFVERVWLGTSVENAETAARIDALSVTPAIIRFISFEPLSAPVGEADLRSIH
ncbi:DUF5131 family protein [Celeribacter baekdonensis]|uniref:DUF5131 family protein n=1 Tax=Celeribacter baekdonensis TaxID=875171 RepID=UPI003A943D5E